MSKIEQLCQEFIKTHDNRNLVHYIETTPISTIGLSNIMKILKVLESYVVELKKI